MPPSFVSAGTAPFIVQQPLDTNLVEASSAILFVTADATPPITYQWYKVRGGTTTSLGTNGNLAWITIGPVIPFDSGTQYWVAITNANGSTNSAVATITAVAGVYPPLLANAITHGNPIELEVIYSTSASMATATNAANYSINNGVTIRSIVPGTGLDRVLLKTSTIAEGKIYTVTVSGIKDLGQTPNTIPPNSQVQFLQVGGAITHKFYQLSSAGSIADVTNSAVYRNDQPSTQNYPDAMEWPPNGGNESGDNYGNELFGYFVPCVSGSYTFYTSGTDQITVFLSPDTNPANKVQICFEPAWNDSRQWVATSRRGAPPQTSLLRST